MGERIRIGDMLVAAGFITDAQVKEALARQRSSGLRLGEELVAMGLVTEVQLTQMLSNQLSIPWVSLYHVEFSRELLDLLPAEVADAYCAIPIYVRKLRKQGDTLYVAMDDPLNLDALQKVADASGLPVKAMVAAPGDIENAIRVYYLGLPPLEAKKPVKAQPEEKKAPEKQPEPVAEKVEARAPEPTIEEEKPAPEPVRSATPSAPPPPKKGGPRFLTLTLLDGTQVRLPSPDAEKKPVEKEEKAEHGLTTRDLIHALSARAAGEDVSDVLPDGAWEPLFAALLSVLMRKGLVADWEFVDEWKKHRKKG